MAEIIVSPEPFMGFSDFSAVVTQPKPADIEKCAKSKYGTKGSLVTPISGSIFEWTAKTPLTQLRSACKKYLEEEAILKSRGEAPTLTVTPIIGSEDIKILEEAQKKKETTPAPASQVAPTEEKRPSVTPEGKPLVSTEPWYKQRNFWIVGGAAVALTLAFALVLRK